MKRNLAAALLVSVAACADDGFEKDVAGIARLSILQVGLLSSVLAEDERCGFDAESAVLKFEHSVEFAGRGFQFHQRHGITHCDRERDRIVDLFGLRQIQHSALARLILIAL